MTRKAKIYAALATLALTALVIDRCFIGTTAPQTTLALENNASPDESEDPTTPRPQRSLRHPAVAQTTAPELHFPRNLPAFDASTEIRDIFTRLEEESLHDPSQPSSGKKSASKKTVADEGLGRETFLAVHRIDAVMTQDRLKIALVDGRWLRPGDVLDHCTLTHIEGDSATFQCHDGEALLFPSRKRTPQGD